MLAVTQGLDCSLNNIRRSLEIWLTNAEIDDGMPCSRPFLRPGKDIEGAFCLQGALEASMFIFNRHFRFYLFSVYFR